jgi:hypothetical protein
MAKADIRIHACDPSEADYLNARIAQIEAEKQAQTNWARFCEAEMTVATYRERGMRAVPADEFFWSQYKELHPEAEERFYNDHPGLLKPDRLKAALG